MVPLSEMRMTEHEGSIATSSRADTVSTVTSTI